MALLIAEAVSRGPRSAGSGAPELHLQCHGKLQTLNISNRNIPPVLVWFYLNLWNDVVSLTLVPEKLKHADVILVRRLVVGYLEIDVLARSCGPLVDATLNLWDNGVYTRTMRK
jgi:hypothetical protein